ncbi:hypothetical protein [Methanosphaera stadtmanae]|uniref:hypothetical protein n=1 Tax=Methanosphaera stadtmanae TaxID=2317 RepID=UPI0026765CBD|nr:hypothetical protein [Methanosphaera stadtmanae]
MIKHDRQLKNKQKRLVKKDFGVYYDSKLNNYFDSNNQTVKEGQFAKKTSKKEIKETLQEIGY